MALESLGAGAQRPARRAWAGARLSTLTAPCRLGAELNDLLGVCGTRVVGASAAGGGGEDAAAAVAAWECPLGAATACPAETVTGQPLMNHVLDARVVRGIGAEQGFFPLRAPKSPRKSLDENSQ